MWRKQYSEAIEWAKKSQNQFTRANMKHVTNPEERIKLYHGETSIATDGGKQEKTKAKPGIRTVSYRQLSPEWFCQFRSPTVVYTYSLSIAHLIHCLCCSPLNL